MSVDTQVNPVERKEEENFDNDDSGPPPLVVDGELPLTVEEKEDVETQGNDRRMRNILCHVSGIHGDYLLLGSDKESVPLLEEDFPLKQLSSLDEQLGRPKWVVPVRTNDELEVLTKAAIRLAREGRRV